MLLFAKLSICYCVWFCFGHPWLKISWLKCKICLKFENLRIIDWKSYFWEIWVQNKCFWKVFHLILMHFIHKILYFEEFLHKIVLFLKKLCFPDFWLIKSISQPIENAIKILVWIWPFRSLLDWFWINRRHFQSIESNFRSIKNRIGSFFFKPWVFMCSITFKLFQNKFLSLFDRSRLQTTVFVVFPQISSRVFVL